MNSKTYGQSPSPACSQLREPLEAPRDGTFILGAFGWPWLVPAVWNSYDQEWVVCHMQAQPLPGGYIFRPANAIAVARQPGANSDNIKNP